MTRGIAAVIVILVVTTLFATGDASPADVLPKEVTLSDALALMVARSPFAAAERARIDVAAMELVTAGLLPNPSLSYGGVRLVSGVNTGAATQHQAVIEQPLLLFGQRGARKRVAQLNVDSEQAGVAASLAARGLAVRQAFATLLGAEARLHIIDEAAADLERVESVVRGRTHAGDRSTYDLIRIEVETRVVQVELDNARAEADDASAGLAAAVGIADWRPRAKGTLRPADIPTDFAELWQTAQQRRPALRAAVARQAAARGGIGLARRERLPVPALAAGTLVTRDENSTSAFFGVSVPLPIFDRGQGTIGKALAEEHAETLALDAEITDARAALVRSSALLVKRREALARLEREVMERMPTMRRMAEDAYREGAGTILELLDAFRTAKERRLLHAEQLEKVKLAEAEVVATAGIEEPVHE